MMSKRSKRELTEEIQPRYLKAGKSWCNILSVKSRTLTKVVSQKYPK